MYDVKCQKQRHHKSLELTQGNYQAVKTPKKGIHQFTITWKWGKQTNPQFSCKSIYISYTFLTCSPTFRVIVDTYPVNRHTSNFCTYTLAIEMIKATAPNSRSKLVVLMSHLPISHTEPATLLASNICVKSKKHSPERCTSQQPLLLFFI